MSERMRIILTAIFGVTFAVGMGVVMVYSGITDQSAFDVVGSAFRRLQQGSGPVADLSLPGVAFDIPVTLALAGDPDGASAVRLPDGLLLALGSIEDTRCAAGDQCVSAGELAAVLTLTGGVRMGRPGDSNEVRLGETASPSVASGAYRLELQSITDGSATIIVRTTER